MALFQGALTAVELPFVLLYIFGPGGIGKTTLVRELARLAGEMGARTVYLDARNVDPSPDFFQDALRQVLGLNPETEVATGLVDKTRTVILIDTYELLTPIDSWLRNDFLPQLPDEVIVVLAGRQPPTLAWRVDPGWQAMMRTISLRNLNESESRDYLARRGIPATQHDAILSFTHGHALALSLVADVAAQQPGVTFQPEKAPDVITSLLEQLIQQVPTAAHREALEACALVRLTTESLLAELLPQADAHALFDWLRTLSFMDAERRGIFPHDLAREALNADLRWRNPDMYAELHGRARNYYLRHVQQGTPQEQRRTLSDYIYLHRENPAVKPYFEWQASGSVFTDQMRPKDVPEILAMITTHEGERSASLAAHWLAQQPEKASVFRQASGEVQGFLLTLALERIGAPEREADAAVAAAWRALQQRTSLRVGETATLFRFWLARDSYQGVSPVQSRIFLNIVQHYLTMPGLVYSFLPCADPNFWLAIFSYADLQHVPEADFVVDGRPYGVFGHDWRKTPPMAWLELMAQRELGAAVTPATNETTETQKVLSEEEFATAVHDALRDFTDTAGLQSNPLLNCKMVIARAGEGNRVAALQALLRETAETFQANPRQMKLYRALHHTYFQPAVTQEQAAELLDLPFSTYRRHLRQGIEELTARLWLLEASGK
jgi:hypothetical protein